MRAAARPASSATVRSCCCQPSPTRSLRRLHDRRVTIFSTGEEQQLEGPSGLGGNVQFYPVNALAEAGARVESVANWHSNVVVDHELITGQQPMSAPEFGDVLVAKLKQRAH